MGLLFCCIAINKTSTVVAWIIRVAPAVALLNNTYGVYHLCRSATGRPPASTASYMLFAAMVDTGLLPFLAFASYLSYLDWKQNRYGWSTLFNDNLMSYKIIFAFFILSCTLAGVTLISLIVDIYLATIFRKIAKLPPDMNPLEPNLTSRHGQQHKRNKSTMDVTAKHMSGSTLAAKRESAMSGRRVPYLHARTDSADSVTLYGNESARNSRIEMRKGFNEHKNDPYLQSKNNSRVTLAPTRPSSAVNPAENTRSPGTGLDHRPARSSGLANSRSPDRSPERPSSWLSYLDYEGVPTDLSEEANQQLNQDVRALSPVSALSSRGPSLDHPRQMQERENWYHGSARNSNTHLPTAHNATTFSASNIHLPTAHDTTNPNYSNAHLPTAHNATTLNASTLDLTNGNLAPPEFQHLKKRSREPLGMNPPTPTNTQPQYQDENGSVYTPAHAAYGALDPGREVLTPTNGNAQRPSRPSSLHSTSFVGSGDKSRFYGDLRASIGSIGAEQRVGKEADSNIVEICSDSSTDSDDYDRTKTMQSTSDYSANFEVYASDSDDEGAVSELNVQHLRMQNGNANRYSPPKHGNRNQYSPPSPIRVDTNTHDARPAAMHTESWNVVRQVSNSTGYNLHGGYAGLGTEFGVMARRREVSGKVAEEGRSPMGRGRVEEVQETTPQKKGLGASAGGWARFKGL